MQLTAHPSNDFSLFRSISRDFAMRYELLLLLKTAFTCAPVRFNAAVTQTLLLHASEEPPEFSSDQDDSFRGDDDGSGLELE